ncbi:MAG: helix-turn-helix transcriptional regulator [Bacteroidota bacterium]
MDLLSTLTIVLFLIGAVQGGVYGSILWTGKKGNRIGNRLLAMLLFLLSYRLLVQSMRLFGLGYYDTWYYFMLDLSWVIGPLLYFYVKAQTVPKFHLTRKDWIHFLPLAIQVSFSIFVRLQNLYWEGTRESLTWAGYWGYVVWMNYSTIYIVASISIVSYAFLAERALKDTGAAVAIDAERIAWIQRIVLAFKWYFLLVLAILFVDLLAYNVIISSDYYYFNRFFYFPFFVGVSILTYWVGLEGFKRKDEDGVKEKVVLPQDKKVQLEQIAQLLEEKMREEKLYTQPDLSLQVVADHLQVKPYLISHSLKEILQTRFNEYVNTWRVKEVQQLLKEPQNQKYTLLSIALEAGFNSKSSFNRAVKKHLGISPSELKTFSEDSIS